MYLGPLEVLVSVWTRSNNISIYSFINSLWPFPNIKIVYEDDVCVCVCVWHRSIYPSITASIGSLNYITERHWNWEFFAENCAIKNLIIHILRACNAQGFPLINTILQTILSSFFFACATRSIRKRRRARLRCDDACKHGSSSSSSSSTVAPHHLVTNPIAAESAAPQCNWLFKLVAA